MKIKHCLVIHCLICICFLFHLHTAFAQVGISIDNSMPDNSAMLDVKSTSKGMLVPGMTASQRDAIASPAKGLLIFCTDDSKYYYNQGTPGASDWLMLGSNWMNAMNGIFYNGGNVGIGNINPNENLVVNGAIRIGTTSSVCDAAHRGTFKFIRGYPGISDRIFVCCKQSDGTYMWNRITFSGPPTVTCDDFNRSNSTTVSGWIEQSGDWDIYSNRLQSEASGFWQYITYSGSTQADGFITARIIYPSGSFTKAGGLLARFTSTSSHIYAKIQDNSDCGYFDSYFIYNNGSLLTYETDMNYGTDVYIKLFYNGTGIVFKIDVDRDGTFDYSYSTTVTNTGSGLCGAHAYQQCYFDDWCYGTNEE